MDTTKFLKSYLEGLPPKDKPTGIDCYTVITPKEIIYAINNGDDVHSQYGIEGTPSENIPHYFIFLNGQRHSMYDINSDKTKKYGVCWDSTY
jgi:hypothetical protein